jgi:hypothetical protein
MEYETFNACWTINDDAELKEALVSLQQDKTKLPYSKNDVDRWLSEVIYGGRNRRDVLEDYTEFILNGGNYRIPE